MKKFIALSLALALLCALPACAEKTPPATQPQVTQPTVAEPEKEVITDEVRAKLDEIVGNYQGIVYLTHNGRVVYTHVSGTNDAGDPLTVDSPMYLCSISKQFCAAAILMLRDQGKLSLEDTLETYFPEYTIGKGITLKNLMSMRSGIVRDFVEVIENPELYEQKSDEEINTEMMDWIFRQPLNFEPDTQFEYSNVNYILLSYVVEMLSGQDYEDFIRQNIFEPLDMTHSGFVKEVPEHPEWGLTYENWLAGSMLGDQPQGCGNIISTAADMDIWMTALPSGRVISRESYQEMTTSYSDDAGSINGYGYGLVGCARDGWGHSGGNKGYTSWMYFNEDYGYNLFIVSGKTPTYLPDYTDKVFVPFLNTVFVAENEVSH